MSRIGVLLGRACSPGSLPSTLTSINSDVDTLRNPFSFAQAAHSNYKGKSVRITRTSSRSGNCQLG